MLFVLIACFGFALTIDRFARQGRIDLARMNTQYQLFMLRDWLRLEMINGNIKNDRWFEYMDTTLTRSIDHIDSLSVWIIFFLRRRHRDDLRISEALAALDTALNDPENVILKRIYDQYIDRLGSYLGQRHYVSYAVVRGWRRLAGGRNHIVLGLSQFYSAAPETSTLLKYALA